MRRLLALRAEIFRSADYSPTEILLPDAVDCDTRRERVSARNQPEREIHARRFGIRRQRVQHRRNTRPSSNGVIAVIGAECAVRAWRRGFFRNGLRFAHRRECGRQIGEILAHFFVLDLLPHLLADYAVIIHDEVIRYRILLPLSWRFYRR